MKQDLAQERKDEEEKVYSALGEELKQLRERMRGEVEEGREALKEAHKEELEAMRREGDKELHKMKEAFEKKGKEDIEALQREKEREHEDVKPIMRNTVCDLFAYFRQRKESVQKQRNSMIWRALNLGLGSLSNKQNRRSVNRCP